MLRPRQFSLAQLFTEVLLIAAIIGAVRLIVVLWGEQGTVQGFILPLMFALPVLVGAAVGTLFGKTTSGAVWGTAASVVYFFLAPAVMQ